MADGIMNIFVAGGQSLDNKRGASTECGAMSHVLLTTAFGATQVPAASRQPPEPYSTTLAPHYPANKLRI
ncbi:unnamed protein product [Colias eurytheme]|nr:unnamed protein product [Colias eurytheme]